MISQYKYNTMNVQIQSLKFNADVKLLDFIQKKMDKLDTFYERIISGEVLLKLNNEGVKNKTVEIKLNIPGDQLFSIGRSRTFESASEEAIAALKSQLIKVKEKVIAR